MAHSPAWHTTCSNSSHHGTSHFHTRCFSPPHQSATHHCSSSASGACTASFHISSITSSLNSQLHKPVYQNSFIPVNQGWLKPPNFFELRLSPSNFNSGLAGDLVFGGTVKAQGPNTGFKGIGPLLGGQGQKTFLGGPTLWLLSLWASF